MATRKRQRLREEDEDESKVDRISFLPDELLMMILCSLSFKEATATSILGRRWRYLHHWTRKLDLDQTGFLLKSQKSRISPHLDYERIDPTESDRTNPKDLDEKRLNYIKWVDDVISMRKSSTLDEFRVCFNLDRFNSKTIEKWIQIALSRSIQNLALDLTEAGEKRRSFQYHYILPNHFVRDKNFKLLKKLSTNNVNVTGIFVKDLFQNCRVLQHLCVSYSDIAYVEIVEPSESFKCLELSLCHNLSSLVIRDSSIVTLKLQTKRRIQRVVLENVPLLTEFHCWPDHNFISMKHVRDMFSSLLPQLRLLKLYFLLEGLDDQYEDIKDVRNFCKGIDLSNLKQLVVVDSGHFMLLQPLIKLVNAFPRLERFVLETPIVHEAPRENYSRKMERARTACKKIPKKYTCLKEMEIVGYAGLHHEFEMMMYLVENGAALRNIVVRTQPITLRLDSWWDYIPHQKTSCKLISMAQALRKYLPPRINLEIL